MRRFGWYKWAALILLGTVMLFSSRRVLAAGDQGADETVIRVGYTENGQMIQEKDGTFSGYGVEYLQLLSAYTGWKYEYVPVSEKNRKEELRKGNIDLLCNIAKEGKGNEGLLLSKKASGMYYAVLCAKKDNDSVCFDEYDAMNGKHIVVNTNLDMEPMLESFAKRYHIEYTPVYCGDFAEMEHAMETGEAELMVASNLRNLSDYKYVAKMGMQDQYFAVADQNAELMRQLDEADEQLKLEMPFIQGVLYEKYYGRPSQTILGMTREEQKFIQNGRTIRVACDRDSYPIEYVDENGNYSGVYADAMKLISEKTGLQFAFTPLQDYKQAWSMLSNGEVDMTAGMYISSQAAEEYHISYSQSYMNAEYTLVARSDVQFPEQPVIVVPEGYVGIRHYIGENYSQWTVLLKRNITECLTAVENKEADGTIINTIFLQTAYNLNDFDNLVILPMRDMAIPIRCGIGGKDAKILKSIVDKAIMQIPAEEFERCRVENAINIAYEPTMREMLQRLLPYAIGMVVLVVVIFMVSLKAREKHFKHLAMTDAVTGLWNGVKFRKEAEDLLEHNKQREYQMISLDLEHFKYVNNDFGEKAADGILQLIGKRIHMQFDSDAIYARDMADMFLILTEKKEDLEERLTTLSDEIVFENNGREQRYKPVIKCGICPVLVERNQSVSLGEYIDRAIMARKSIKGNVAVMTACYNQEMSDEIIHERKIEKRMETAIKQREFVVYFQPKVQLKTETLIGAEALVRWMDPEEGLVPPGCFIPIFERNGFIIRLDFYVYEEVLKCMSRWLQEGRPPIVISMNVSRAHISTPDFVKKLVTLADQYEVPHQLIELELTETVLGGKKQAIFDFIAACKAEKFNISIDDFGSGYSSLNLLKELPVDVLKIDREFLNETEESERSSIIVEQVVEMAAKIHIQTLCEGVETKKQAEFLRQIGCDMAQGYLYSRPVPVGEFEKMLGA